MLFDFAVLFFITELKFCKNGFQKSKENLSTSANCYIRRLETF